MNRGAAGPSAPHRRPAHHRCPASRLAAALCPRLQTTPACWPSCWMSAPPPWRTCRPHPASACNRCWSRCRLLVCPVPTNQKHAETELHCCPMVPVQLLTFVNAFMLLNDANKLAVFTAGSTGCHLAYCSPRCLPPSATAPQAAAGIGPPSVAVLEGLQQTVATAAAAAAAQVGQSVRTCGSNCQLSSALSRMLCFLNTQQRRAAAGAGLGGSGGGAGAAGAVPSQRAQQPARVLCLTAAPDVPSQYISVMNAIFSAQVRGFAAASGGEKLPVPCGSLWHQGLPQPHQPCVSGLHPNQAPACGCSWAPAAEERRADRCVPAWAPPLHIPAAGGCPVACAAC